jgi:hypothetical protein
MSGVDHLTAVSLVSSGRERLARGLRLLLEDVDCPRAKHRTRVSSEQRCRFGAFAEETRQMLLEEYFRNAPLCDLVEPWEWHTLPGYRKRSRPKAKRRSSFDTPLNPPLEGVPRYVMARDLVGTVFPVSVDLILREARKHGIGRKMAASSFSAPTIFNTCMRSCHAPQTRSPRQIPALGYPGHPPGHPH